MPNDRPRVVLGEQGTYDIEVDQLPQWAPLLPDVTVRVCAACNNEWMSALEARVRGILSPLLFDGKVLHLGKEEQELVAAWACKTFMTYSLRLGAQSNPFSPEEYSSMRATIAPPAGVRLWIFSANSIWAHVGIDLKPWATYRDEFRPHLQADNSALGLLAVALIPIVAPPACSTCTRKSVVW